MGFSKGFARIVDQEKWPDFKLLTPSVLLGVASDTTLSDSVVDQRSPLASIKSSSLHLRIVLPSVWRFGHVKVVLRE